MVAVLFLPNGLLFAANAQARGVTALLTLEALTRRFGGLVGSGRRDAGDRSRAASTR